MNTQSEQQLENQLIEQLQALGWEKVVIKDEVDLVANLKTQLEKHNKVQLSEDEFSQILNKLSRGNIFDKAKTLRDKVDFKRDDGTTGYIELINQIHWCKNEYQVTHQITMQGKYENHYDVTLLVNGLPLAQIELKRRGLEIKEAFNQTRRYHKHSFNSGYGLFNYIQLFVISNGVNTKYYANNPIPKGDKPAGFEFTFFWADKDNKKISQLSAFADSFLEKCQFSKMVTKYIVLNETLNILMVLRPYQYYAVEAIVERVQTSRKHGYIWHTTGSGKTLTSFKAAQILTQNPKVHKVVFVVDRKDLDYQTIKEFNAFQPESVDSTTNTKTLVKQFADDNALIVTTLQKLNTAISNTRYAETMNALKDERMIFIFDECHRSQFGDTHKRITEYFSRVQMFGFTGTPIFADNAAKNALGKRTTKDLFDECLHKYVITDAIRDENVLKFSVEYIRTFKVRDEVQDIEVEAIDTSEVMEAPERLEKITNYIIANHDRKTHNRQFTAMMCVANVQTLMKYYELFKAKKLSGEHNLKVATIFSYSANEEEIDLNGFLESDEIPQDGQKINPHSREKLDEYIADYNAMFNTNYSTKDSKLFYGYYQNIAKRVKNREVDILLVVNMFLTGFDSPKLNTIYVDKNLKYHGLIQAFSRTNRVESAKKSQGNVVSFRNLKSATDTAIELFANKEAQEEIILAPYEDYVEKFTKALESLYEIAPSVDSVDELLTEEDEVAFVKAFRDLIRLKNVLDTFTQFQFMDLGMDEQTFQDYRSKYLDLYEKVRNDKQKEKVSILGDLDFEVELISRDKINVSYIIKLLKNIKGKDSKAQAKVRQSINDILDGDIQLRSKKELIEQFIEHHLPKITNDNELDAKFEAFWNEEKRKALIVLSEEEKLDIEGLEQLMAQYLYTEITPMSDEIISIRREPPSLLERSSVAERVITKLKDFVVTFIDGVD